MLALFLLMMVPVCGWYFIGTLASPRLLSLLPAESHQQVLTLQHEIRFKLGITLGISVVLLGGVIVYLRRTILEPLELLARQARSAALQGWHTPPETTRPDEVGDLARALDSSFALLQHRAQEAEAFAAHLSHELRTPLAAIRGAAELLCTPELAPADRQRFARSVVAESHRMERLVTALLSLARADHQELEPQERALLLPVLQRSLDCFAAVASQQQVRVELQQSDPELTVRAGNDVLMRIMTVLVENAVEHTQQGGSVVVSVTASGDKVEVAVEDSGPGVPEHERPRVFDRWYALRNASRNGTGLGLAIARSLVEKVGGSIDVSDSPLGGARFSFCVPAFTGSETSVSTRWTSTRSR